MGEEPWLLAVNSWEQELSQRGGNCHDPKSNKGYGNKFIIVVRRYFTSCQEIFYKLLEAHECY